MTSKLVIIRALLGAALCSFVGVSISYALGCTDWSFDADNCLPVSCPSGCYDNGNRGVTSSECSKPGGDLCCNCWFQQRYCSLNGHPATNCPYRTGSPTGLAWDNQKETAAGHCAHESGWPGKVCLTAADPF